LTAKVYGFSAEPEAFKPVIEMIDEIAIEKHTSRSEVIVDILLNHFGMSNSRRLRKMDYSGVLAGRSKA
jgi:hypothetical protein